MNSSVMMITIKSLDFCVQFS